MPYTSTELYANKNHSLSDDTTDWYYSTLITRQKAIKYILEVEV